MNVLNTMEDVGRTREQTSLLARFEMPLRTRFCNLCNIVHTKSLYRLATAFSGIRNTRSLCFLRVRAAMGQVFITSLIVLILDLWRQYVWIHLYLAWMYGCHSVLPLRWYIVVKLQDTFRGRVCQCPLVDGVQFQGDGYTTCEGKWGMNVGPLQDGLYFSQIGRSANGTITLKRLK